MSKVYFRSTSAAGGSELWVTDGSAAGTKLLKDIVAGAGSSFPSYLHMVGGKLYFTATDATHGTELWISDGSAAGTTLVKDLNPGTGSSVFEQHGSYTNLSYEPTLLGSKVFFFANDGTNQRSLWSTGGTPATTSLIQAGTAISNPDHLTAVGSKLYFYGSASGHYGLYVTTGAANAATVLSTDFVRIESDLISFGGKVYFAAYNTTSGTELWRSDGTIGGTGLFKDIDPSNGGSPTNFTVAGSRLFFDAYEPTHGDELWMTDGTTTAMVKDIWAGDNNGYGAYTTTMTAVGNRVYFAANDGTHGEELWVSDGTSGGTHMVRELGAGAAGTRFHEFLAVGSTLFFTAQDATHGTELWRTDGTAAGTVLIRDIIAGPTSSHASNLTAAGASVYFTAWDASGEALWRTDGTSIGTVKVQAVPTALNMSPDTALTVFKGKLFFAGNDAGHGIELWSSDGTTAGTALFKDLAPGMGGLDAANDSEPSELTVIGNTMYFTSLYSSPNGPALLKTDGTAAGTTQVATFNSTVGDLTPFNGKLYFIAGDQTGKVDVWVSDGLAGATHTHVLKSVTASGGGFPSELTVSGSHLYFVADDGNGPEIWVTDGTAAHTTMLKDIIPPSVNYVGNPGDLTNVNGTLFFTVHDGVHGFELWKSNGTSAGTVIVEDIVPGTDGSGPQNLVAVGSKVYFTASDGFNVGDHGSELWVSDGTDGAGTHLVKDIAPDSTPSNAVPLAAFNGMLVFRASDGTHGAELWITNAAGTDATMLKDINPGFNFGPTDVTVVGSKFYFYATSDLKGRELWVSDGTTVGTKMLKDFGDSGDGNPMVAIGNTVYFTADEGQGPALWKSNGTAAGTVRVTHEPTFSELVSDTAAATATASNGANRILGTTAANTIHALNGDDFVDGGAGADKLYGDANNDTLLGGSGNDRLEGGAGNDWLEGDANQDTMLGGDGNDAYIADLTTDVASESNTVMATGGNDVVYFIGTSGSFSLGANVERLTLGGSSAISGTGNTLANTIIGNGAANVINGSTGKDTLTGGLGADHFRFTTTINAATNVDTVTDFTHGQGDKIDLDNAVMAALGTTTGTLGTQFYAAAHATNGNDFNAHIVYDTSTGKLYYDSNGSGAGGMTQIALIGTTTHPTLVVGDFAIV